MVDLVAAAKTVYAQAGFSVAMIGLAFLLLAAIATSMGYIRRTMDDYKADRRYAKNQDRAARYREQKRQKTDPTKAANDSKNYSDIQHGTAATIHPDEYDYDNGQDLYFDEAANDLDSDGLDDEGYEYHNHAAANDDD